MKTIDLQENRFVAEHVISEKPPQTFTGEVNVRMLRYPPPSDLPQEQLLAAVEQSGTIDFWTRPEEDGYTEADGTPL